MTTRLQIKQMELIEGGTVPCKEATIRFFLSGLTAAATIAALSNPITFLGGAAAVASVGATAYSAYEVVKACGDDSEE